MTDINFKLLGPKLSRVFLVSCLIPYAIYDNIINNEEALKILDTVNKYGKNEANIWQLDIEYRYFVEKYGSRQNHINKPLMEGLYLSAVLETSRPNFFCARRAYFCINSFISLMNHDINLIYSNQNLQYKNLLESKKSKNSKIKRIRSLEKETIHRKIL